MASEEEVVRRLTEQERDNRTFDAVNPGTAVEKQRPQRRPNPAGPGPVTPTS